MQPAACKDAMASVPSSNYALKRTVQDKVIRAIIRRGPHGHLA